MKRGHLLIHPASVALVPALAGLLPHCGVLAGVAGVALLLGALLLGALLLVLRRRQRRRGTAARQEAAEAAGETNRLLLSLLAHDLRSPLALADQGFQYVEQSVAGGYPIDRSMLADVRARLQRSLRAIEMVLSLAKKNAEGAHCGEAPGSVVDVRGEIAAEVASFRYEAEARDKHIVTRLDEVPDGLWRVDVLVLRQAIAIVVDNAVRYADAGPIRVSASVAGSLLEVRVEDPGPGFGARRAGDASGGLGLGLRLCGALLARAGGSLSTERDTPTGTVVAIRLPAAPVAGAATAPPLEVFAGV
jgi:signal transduction histidine kinase